MPRMNPRASNITMDTDLIYSHRDRADKPKQAEVRLAVTADHCVWYINPYNGRAEILAGHQKASGYCDCSQGLMARFSSPKGIVNIGSVVLVADYWNNVIRCINLYTTNVDTIVDFSPQGPVAICASDSGSIYVLDGDNIHHANMLRMTSMPGGLSGDDQNVFSSLFSQPHSRQSRASSIAMSQAGPELWDVYTQKASQFGRTSIMGSLNENTTMMKGNMSAMDQADGKTLEGRNNWRNNWSGHQTDDFNSQLAFHLDDLVCKDEVFQRRKQKKKEKGEEQIQSGVSIVLKTNPKFYGEGGQHVESGQRLLLPGSGDKKSSRRSSANALGEKKIVSEKFFSKRTRRWGFEERLTSGISPAIKTFLEQPHPGC